MKPADEQSESDGDNTSSSGTGKSSRDQTEEVKDTNSEISKIEEKAKTKRLNFEEAVRLFNEAKPTRALQLLISNGFIRVQDLRYI